MMGPPRSRLSEDDESRGLIPRVVEDVFRRMQEVRAGQRTPAPYACGV